MRARGTTASKRRFTGLSAAGTGPQQSKTRTGLVVAPASAYAYASPRLTVTERARSISLLLDGLQGSADAWLLQALTETSGQAGRRTVRLSSAPLFAAGFELVVGSLAGRARGAH